MHLSKKATALLVIVTVLVSFLFTNSLLSSTVEAKEKLGVFVSPFDFSFKLAVNENKTFTVLALNGTEPYKYSWQIQPSDGSFQISINGVTHDLNAFAENLTVEGDSLTLSFPQATREFVSIQALAVDDEGLTGLSHSFIVTDPATYPGYKFDGSTSNAKYIARADGTGWFYVTKGLTGEIVSAWTSESATTTIEYAMSEGGLIALADGAFTSASIDVPADVTLIADPSVTGITYASIADGARIDEPNFNAAFGGYSGGTYTIVINQSSVATTANWSLAFKPDNSIHFVSTNASTTIDDAITACSGGGSIYVTPGTYTANVSVATGIRFVVEEGATGVTVNIASGATALIEDYENHVTNYYSSGSLLAHVTWSSGTTTLAPSWVGAWNTTVEAIVEAYSAMAWKGGWNTTVEDIINTAFLSQAWNSAWDTNVTSLIAGASILWSQITDANVTVEQVVEAYSAMAWKGGWNTTVEQIIESYALTWKGNWDTSVNALIAAADIAWSKVVNIPFVGDYTIIVQTNDPISGNYSARYPNGTLIVTSTNASYVVNYALDGLTAGRTWQETVYLKGNFTQTHPFMISSHTKLFLDGRVTLAAGANCNQLVNTHPTAFDSDIEVTGGTYDGNGGEQTSGSGLVFTTATEDSTYDVTRIHDVTFHGQKTNGITITNSAAYHNPYFVNNIWCHDIGEIGMDLYNIVDSEFSDLILQGNDGNLRVVGGYLKFNHLYLAGSNYWNLRVYGTALWFTDVFADYNTVNGFCPVLLDGCKWSHFQGFTIRNLGTANNNTNSAVKVSLSSYDGTTNSTNNTFDDFTFIKTGTADWKYGIEETDSASIDRNQYCNINGLAVATATLYLRGAESKNQHTNIIGTVTEV